MSDVFDENMWRREEEQLEQYEMQERNEGSGEDTHPLLDNDQLLNQVGHDNQGFQDVETETSFTNDGASTSQPAEDAQALQVWNYRSPIVQEVESLISREFNIEGWYHRAQTRSRKKDRGDIHRQHQVRA